MAQAVRLVDRHYLPTTPALPARAVDGSKDEKNHQNQALFAGLSQPLGAAYPVPS